MLKTINNKSVKGIKASKKDDANEVDGDIDKFDNEEFV